MRGKVKFYNADKGYGFVAGDDGRDVFIGSIALRAAGIETLGTGDVLDYEVETDQNGRPRAVAIEIVEQAARVEHQRAGTSRTGGEW